MTPEAALFTAILEQAINDLGDREPSVRDEARAFFLNGGTWELSRVRLCAAVGVDPDVLVQQLRRAGKLTAEPGPPAMKQRSSFTPDDLKQLIPAETAFRPADIEWPAEVSESVRQLRLKFLVTIGYVEQIGNGFYALTSLNHPRMRSNKERVFSVLEHEPMTTQKLANLLRPRITPIDVYTYCLILVADGLAERVAPATFRLRQAQIAA